jgi:hypothetical protein
MQMTPRASLLEQQPRVGGWFRPLDGPEADGAAVWHPFHQQTCTLRLLPCVDGQQDLMRKLVRRMHRLRHDNLVPIHDLILRPEQVGLLEGEHGGYTLRDSLSEMGALQLNEALVVFRQVLLGASALHKAHLVHGDLRPENIVLDVTDGVLTARLRGLGPGMLGAEPEDARYLSPERIGGAKADARSDIFALGVMFYECLAGRRPFLADEPWALRKLIRTTEPQPLQQLAPNLPMEVAFAVASALKAEPSQRFADARSFARAFPDDVVLSSPSDPSLPPVDDELDEPEVTEVLELPEPANSDVDEPSLTANALADAVGDIDWDEVRRPAGPVSPLPGSEENLTEQLGGRSVDVLLETSRIIRLLALPAVLATGLMLMLTWQNITGAHETRIQTSKIEDSLSQLMGQAEDLGSVAIEAGVEPNAVRPLVERYSSASSEAERRVAAETMATALLRMVRSLPEATDSQTLQERRRLELRINTLLVEVKSYNDSTDRSKLQGREPMAWLAELLRL